MKLDALFYDNAGEFWEINITYGDILRVRQHVAGVDKKPLDLCLIAETGDFKQVTDHIEIVVKCVYWLLYPQLKAYSGLDGIELQEWFYNRVDGVVIEHMTKAWYEALINFTPSPVIKAAMITAGNLKRRAEIIAAIELLAGQLEESMNAPESSELTPEDLATAN